jgi:hypothetical protein
VKKASDILKQIPEAAEFTVTKQVSKNAEAIELVRTAREKEQQELVFSSRPFVLCGLPVKRPKKNELIHIRRNGDFFLRITGDPQFGLPFGQDRLIPIWVATLALRQKSRHITFKSAAEILETFGLPKDGPHYRRLVEGFKRVFTATVYFGTEKQLQAEAVFDWHRFHYFDQLKMWYARSLDQQQLPGDFQNQIVISEAFWDELQRHPIPVDANAIKVLASAPAQLDFYIWLVWRCWKATGEVRIPLFGQGGLMDQLGISSKTAKRDFRLQLKKWLTKTQALWPGCPARVSEDGLYLLIRHAKAIASREA